MGRRTRGMKEYNPEEKTILVLRDVWKVLKQYRNQWPLTLRQIYYRLVAEHGYAKNEKWQRNSLYEYINKARREPRDVEWKIPWEAVRDDGVSDMPFYGYKTEKAFMESVNRQAELFTIDRMSRQDVHIEVLCEAGGMVPQLAKVAHQYGIGVTSSGGFDSSTAKHDLGEALAGDHGKPVHILHIGDLDPSGVHIGKNLDEDVTAFIEYYSGHPMTFHRIAVLPWQVERLELSTQARIVKDDGELKDNRSYDHDYTCEAEALEPNQLAAILQVAIEELIDKDVHAKAGRAEKQIRGRLIKRVQKA